MAHFYNLKGEALPIDGLFHNATVFICLSGPSFKALDKSHLNRPGIITYGVNNSPVGYRPDLWTEVDNVKNFCESIWLDPRIIKFCPKPKYKHKLWNNNAWKESKYRVKDCPGVVYYRRNDLAFDHNSYLSSDDFNWGCTKDQTCSCGFRGCRSVMLPALKMCYHLGFGTVFLLGADFKMQAGRANYHFDQHRHKGSIKNNNNTYRALNSRFKKLRPIFEAQGFNVFNCFQDSGLDAFDYIPYQDALDFATKTMPQLDRNDMHWTTRETLAGVSSYQGMKIRTGMYDREAGLTKLKEIFELCSKSGVPLPDEEFTLESADDYKRRLKRAGRAADKGNSPPPNSCSAGLDLEKLRMIVGAKGDNNG